MDNTLIIGAYSSFFELSVVLNFSYAASEKFRDSLKTGILHNIRTTNKWYSNKQKEVFNKLILMSDDDINLDEKNGIRTKFESIAETLKNEDQKLSKDIESAQKIVIEQTKPIYVYVALFSLCILLLGGQEVAHNLFPTESMNTLIFISLIIIPLLYALTFTSFFVSVPSAILIIFLASISCVFFPVSYQIPLSDKYLVNTAISIAFLPFILSMLKLSAVSFILWIKHGVKYRRANTKLMELEENYQKLQESKKYFSG